MGSLELVSCPSLTSLQVGQSGRASISQSFTVTNTGLTSFNNLGISNVSEVAGALWVSANSSVDAEYIIPITSIAGGMKIWSSGKASTFRFPTLTSSVSDILISGTVVEVDMPSLASIGGQLSIQATTMRNFFAPSLLKIGAMDVGISPFLGKLMLPVLARVEGSLYVGNNSALSTLDFPRLLTITKKTTSRTQLTCLFEGNFSRYLKY